MGKTKIEWSEFSWNPVTGCSKCSPGCLNCYAEKMALRLASIECAELEKHLNRQPAKNRIVRYTPVVDFRKNGWNGKIQLVPSELDQPLHWRKPRRIFVCSMSDLFHESVPFGFIDETFSIMEECLQHTFLLLTKRPKRALNYYKKYAENIEAGISEFFWSENIHLGVSISTQAEADEKIPILLQIPAAIKWISIEPILEAVDFGLTGARTDIRNWPHNKRRIDWVVIGAESIGGKPGRECKLEWVRDLIDQCKAASVPVFVKQIHLNGKLIKDITKFPKDLRVRGYPKGAAK